MAQQMTAAFRKFRKELFERELKPTLESKDARPGDVIKAFRKIEKLLILEADESVVQLAKEGRLKPNVQKQAYGVLATLSTPKCAKALLEAALKDKLAAQALGRCEAGAAEELIAALDSEDFEEFVVAYEAVVKICKNLGRGSTEILTGQSAG